MNGDFKVNNPDLKCLIMTVKSALLTVKVRTTIIDHIYKRISKSVYY